MKTVVLAAFGCISLNVALAQQCDFDQLTLPADTSWYGQDQQTDGDTIYQEAIYKFELNYNSSWGTSTGWSVSNITDNTTPGWSNSYSAITGIGVNGSANYGVCYASNYSNNRVFFEMAALPKEMMVTNTTYAYYSMLNGDDFGKPFGADTNAQGVIDNTNGEDWFLLTIHALFDDSTRTGDSVNFYLADYRFADNNQDYIIDAWSFVDLSSLPICWGLDFVLTSSDTSGGQGMNTPAYFAMDNLLGETWGLDERQVAEVNLFPNPAIGQVIIQSTEIPQEIILQNLNGQRVWSIQPSSNSTELNIEDLDAGVYLVTIIVNGEATSQKLIKQ